MDALHRARREGRAIVPFAEARALGLADAYALSAALSATLIAEGDPVVGFKVGFNGEGAQARFALDEPAWGPLHQSMRVESDGQLRRSRERTMLVEVEVAFLLGARIEDRLESVDALLSSIESVHAAFELPEIRFEGAPTGLDLIADGVGASRFIVGPPFPVTALEAGTLVTLRRDDTLLLEGASGAPLEALLWFVNDRLARGAPLEAGQYVLSGALGEPIVVREESGDGVYQADFGVLGTLGFTLLSAQSPAFLFLGR